WLLAGLGALALAASTAYCVADPAPVHGRYCFQNRYGVVQAGFIPFAIGGLVYFHRPSLEPLADRSILALASLCAIVLVWLFEPLPYTVAPLAGSLIVAAWLVLLLPR